MIMPQAHEQGAFLETVENLPMEFSNTGPIDWQKLEFPSLSYE
jgi:hypothetical protein